jgi:heat shock protein HslJ
VSWLHARGRRVAWAVALATTGAAACAPVEETATQLPSMTPVEYAGLPGPAWQVVAFRSNDDSQPVLRPPGNAVYTVAFGTDGRVSAQLDCNRGTGTWTSPDGGRATSGQIGFGPMAVTRAMCPNPAVGDALERDLKYIRGYLVRGNRLYLSLMADAGTWELAPAR